MIGSGLLSILSSHESYTNSNSAGGGGGGADTNRIAIPGLAYAAEVLIGLGVGLTFSSTSILTSLECTKHSTHATAQSLIAMSRIFGGSCGVAASNALYNTFAHTKLRGVLTQEEIAGLQSSPGQVVNLLSVGQRESVKMVYAQSFDQSARVAVYVMVL